MPQTPPRPPKQRFKETELHGAHIVDQETGEVVPLGNITALQPVAPRRSKSRKEIKFMLVNIEAMPRLKMSKGEWSLFWAVVSYVDRERGEARVATGELARSLDWLPHNVSRSLSALARRGILVRVERGVWQISPLLMTRKAVDKWEIDMESAAPIDWDGAE